MDNKLFSQLHYIISSLEDKKRYNEAYKLHNIFIKLAESKFYVSNKRFAAMGRVIDRIENIESILNQAIQASLFDNDEGKKEINFELLNEMLPEPMKKYVSQFIPSNDPRSAGMYNHELKAILLPKIYDPMTFGTITHELVHAIHREDLVPPDPNTNKPQGLPWQGASLAAEVFDEKTSRGLGPNFEWFDRFQNPSFGWIVDKKTWDLGKQIGNRVSPKSELYWATNEEMLAYFENAVQFFSVENLMKVYEKYFKNPEQYMEFLREAFGTLSISRDAESNEKKFGGLSRKMKKLIGMIERASGSPAEAIEHITEPKWWGQLVGHIANSYGAVRSQLTPKRNVFK